MVCAATFWSMFISIDMCTRKFYELSRGHSFICREGSLKTVSSG